MLLAQNIFDDFDDSAWLNNFILQFTVGCDYWCMVWKPAFGSHVYSFSKFCKNTRQILLPFEYTYMRNIGNVAGSKYIWRLWWQKQVFVPS